MRHAKRTAPAFAWIFWMIFAFAGNAAAASLVWDASSGTVTGYRVHYGVSASKLDKQIDVGNQTTCPLDNIFLEEGTTYYFCVSAYNSAGESGMSNMVSYTPDDNTPPLPPSGVVPVSVQ